MTLPTSGAISASMMNTEYGRASGTAHSIGDSFWRGKAGVASGAISYSNMYGKSNFSAVGDPDDVYGTSDPSYNVTYVGRPSVIVTGSGNYSFAWVLTTTPVGVTLTNPTLQSPNVNKSVTKGGSFYATAVLQCTVTDNATGAQIVVTGINVNFYIDQGV